MVWSQYQVSIVVSKAEESVCYSSGHGIHIYKVTFLGKSSISHVVNVVIGNLGPVVGNASV